MKEFMNYLNALIALFFISCAAGIAVGIIFENNTYALYTLAFVMLFGFTTIVLQLFRSKFAKTL